MLLACGCCLAHAGARRRMQAQLARVEAELASVRAASDARADEKAARRTGGAECASCLGTAADEVETMQIATAGLEDDACDGIATPSSARRAPARQQQHGGEVAEPGSHLLRALQVMSQKRRSSSRLRRYP